MGRSSNPSYNDGQPRDVETHAKMSNRNTGIPARRWTSHGDPELMDFASLSASFAKVDRERRRGVRDPDMPRFGRVDDPFMTRAGFRRIVRWMARAALALFVVYVLLCLPVAWYQNSLVYWSTTTPLTSLDLPEGYEIRRYVSQDPGIEYAAYVHRGNPDMPTVVYLHGRGEGLSVIRMNTGSFVDRDWTVIAPEYPGFAGLKGHASEKVLKAYMGTVYDDLVDRHVDMAKVVIHGNSLGAGPALQLAQYQHGFLLLTAPVASLAVVMHHYAPIYPSFLLRDKWDNLARARTRFRVPARVEHAADDWVVPVEQGRMLAKAAGARYHEYQTGGHMIGYHTDKLRYGVKGFAYDD